MNTAESAHKSYLYIDDWGYLRGTLEDKGQPADGKVVGITFEDEKRPLWHVPSGSIKKIDPPKES